MGFFSGIVKTLTGGSDSSSSNRSGFALLPRQIQNVYKDYASDLSNQFVGGASDNLFTPIGQTPYEDRALGIIEQGVTATPESLQSDIDMQMNPFNDSVINTINREAGGDYSILKQGLQEAGQTGSNRQILGANDIEQTRLDTIGRFKQDQYNRALDNSLNQLTQSRVTDAGLGMTAGDFLRGLDTQTKQAPINAMTSFGQLLGVLPTTGGSESETESSQSNGLFPGGFSFGGD